MTQVIHMHQITRFRANYAVLRIHHAEHFLAMLSLRGLQQLGKPLPFPKRKFLRSDRFFYS